MNKILALVTTDQQAQKLDMIVVSWVHNSADQRYIEISATNQALGQLLVRIKSSGAQVYQQRLSDFHDKLLAALGRFDTQMTAYTGTATLPPNELDIDLKTQLVYLIINP